MTPNNDNEELRSYLMGTLPMERQKTVEERLLAESELFEELQIVEQELIDQYVSRELSSEESRQFESNFLISVDRERLFRFGKNLRRYIDARRLQTAPAVEPALVPPRWFSLRAIVKNPIPVILLILVVLSVGLVAVFRLRLRNETSRVAVQTVVLALTPRATRQGDTSQRLTSAPASRNIRLNLELNSRDFPSYKAELLKEGETVSVREGLTVETDGQRRVVAFEIPGETLAPADYQIKLTGSSDTGETEAVDSYCFRVLDR